MRSTKPEGRWVFSNTLSFAAGARPSRGSTTTVRSGCVVSGTFVSSMHVRKYATGTRRRASRCSVKNERIVRAGPP